MTKDEILELIGDLINNVLPRAESWSEEYIFDADEYLCVEKEYEDKRLKLINLKKLIEDNFQ